MTPKEKAKELIDKFSERTKFFDEYAGWLIHLDSSKAKGHALTAVNLLLNDKHKTEDFYETYYFWQEVKKEIEKL
jgi:hypothetical protein